MGEKRKRKKFSQENDNDDALVKLFNRRQTNKGEKLLREGFA